MIRCIEVRLTIPDNEARTALATLGRLGVAAEGLERADLYRCDVADEAAASLADELRACEAIFNPNKHALVERAGDRPAPGEVWVDEPGHGERSTGTVVVSGRTLAGVRSLERYTAWRLLAPGGVAASPELVAAASRALLCNPAFQRARFEETAVS
jgi:hypothetical protein